ncbi:MAG: DUF3791 domain-containing protein [Bacteroidales bacterium]|jgi:hypothetical protein|nr:DUF3791 domain-containing protein [Bacteroidales bacterium]
MTSKVLNKATSDKVSFITFIIIEFAEAFKMKKQEAYLYLKKYGGLDFLFKHWWALHTDDKYFALKDLYAVCLENGGKR